MKHKQSLIIIILGLLIAACGSDSENSFSSNGTNYVGLETQANIVQANAQTMVETMFGTKDVSLVPTDENGDPIAIPYNILVPRALAETIQDVNANPVASSITAEKILVDQFSCDSGQLDYTITVDDVTGVMSGSMSFRNCVSLDITLNGTADVSGTYDLNNSRFILINLSFAALTASDEFMNYTATGDIGLEFDELITTITLKDYAVTFTATVNAYKFDDFIITITIFPVDPAAMTLSGRFYHPEFGFMLIDTINALLTASADAMPHSGQFSGQGLASELMVTCLDATRYLLEVDPDIEVEGDETDEILFW